MQKFLVLYRSKMSIGEQMAGSTPEERQAGMDAWMAWGAAAVRAVLASHPHHQMGTIEVLQMLDMPGPTP